MKRRISRSLIALTLVVSMIFGGGIKADENDGNQLFQEDLIYPCMYIDASETVALDPTYGLSDDFISSHPDFIKKFTQLEDYWNTSDILADQASYKDDSWQGNCTTYNTILSDWVGTGTGRIAAEWTDIEAGKALITVVIITSTGYGAYEGVDLFLSISSAFVVDEEGISFTYDSVGFDISLKDYSSVEPITEGEEAIGTLIKYAFGTEYNYDFSRDDMTYESWSTQWYYNESYYTEHTGYTIEVEIPITLQDDSFTSESDGFEEVLIEDATVTWLWLGYYDEESWSTGRTLIASYISHDDKIWLSSPVLYKAETETSTDPDPDPGSRPSGDPKTSTDPDPDPTDCDAIYDWLPEGTVVWDEEAQDCVFTSTSTDVRIIPDTKTI